MSNPGPPGSWAVGQSGSQTGRQLQPRTEGAGLKRGQIPCKHFRAEPKPEWDGAGGRDDRLEVTLVPISIQLILSAYLRACQVL